MVSLLLPLLPLLPLVVVLPLLPLLQPLLLPAGSGRERRR